MNDACFVFYLYKRLFSAGYTPEDPGLRAIGYREFFVQDVPGSAWRLSEDLAGVEALVAQNSRRYAKRQITFFASIPGIKWIDCDEDDTAIIEAVKALDLLAFPVNTIDT